MTLAFLVGNLPSFLVILWFIYFLTIARKVRRSPLSSLPGPRITKWTDWVHRYYVFRGQRPHWVHALHEKYGPVVRVSPTEIDVSDVPSAREIHRIGNSYLKSPYKLLNDDGSQSIITTTNPDSHPRHQRLLTSALSDANLLSTMEPLVQARVRVTIQRMREEMNTHGAVDILKWWFFMAADIIGELSFGNSFRMLEKGKKNQYILDLETVAKAGRLRDIFPGVDTLNKVISLPILSEAIASNERLMLYATDAVNRCKTRLALNPHTAKNTLFTKLYAAGEEGLPDTEICDDAQSFIIGGSDTVASTLTYLVWAVCRNPAVQRALVAELRESLQRKEIRDIDLRGLKYLDQVINEVLRLYPAFTPAMLRTVPGKGVMLAGHWIPGGSTVSTQLYSLHQDLVVFPDPEKFDPSRWDSPTKEMTDAFMPFGAGTRTCIGLHLARMELRLATAHFFRAFPTARMSTRENMSDQDMDMAMYSVLSPKGGKCLVDV